MTISSEVRKAGPFDGNDVADTFPFSFKVFTDNDLMVVRADSLGAETVLTLGTDYTVSLNPNQNESPGGSVVTTSPLAAGFKLVLTSKVGNLQPVDLTNQGGFYPNVINGALDRLTILAQQLRVDVDRSAKLPITRDEDADDLLSDIVLIADNMAAVDTVAANIGNVNATGNDIAAVKAVAVNIANINAAVADLPSLAAKVSKTGDTMTGHLEVPARATGNQVPRASEVVPKAGNVTLTGPLEVPAGASGAEVPQAQETLLLAVGGIVTGETTLVKTLTAIDWTTLSSGSQTIDIGEVPSDVMTLTVTGNSTLTLASSKAGAWMLLGLNVTSGTVTWVNVTWRTPGGLAPTIGTGYRFFLFFAASSGSGVYGFAVGEPA